MDDFQKQNSIEATELMCTSTHRHGYIVPDLYRSHQKKIPVPRRKKSPNIKALCNGNIDKWQSNIEYKMSLALPTTLQDKPHDQE